MPEGSALQGQHCTLPSLIMPHGSDSLSLNTPLAFSLCTHALFHIWSRCAFTVWICVSISMLSASQDRTTWPAQRLLQSKPSIKVSYMNPFHIPSWTDQIPLWWRLLVHHPICRLFYFILISVLVRSLHGAWRVLKAETFESVLFWSYTFQEFLSLRECSALMLYQPGALDLKKSTFMMRLFVLTFEATLKTLDLDLLQLATG